MPQRKENPDPVEHSVWVDCPPDEAFHLFTRSFGEWWPLAQHSIYKEDVEECEIEPWIGGRLVERTRDGREEEWGSVTEWDPPERFVFTWHPGRRQDPNETVDVRFETEADGTRVTLIHQGWNRSSEPVCGLRSINAPDWENMLQNLCEAVRQLQAVC